MIKDESSHVLAWYNQRSGNESGPVSGALVHDFGHFVEKSASGYAAEKLKGQAIWLADLPPELSNAFPALYSATWWPGGAKLIMEKIGFRSADEALLSGELSPYCVAEKFSDAVDFVVNNFHDLKTDGSGFSIFDMVKLTRSRLCSIPREYSAQMDFLLYSNHVVIDGVEQFGLMRAFDEIASKGLLEEDQQGASFVHGDLHSGNVLLSASDFKLIDPRGGFPGGGVYSTRYYDFGKVIHDLVCGYNLIKSGLIRADCNNTECRIIVEENSAVERYRIFRGAVLNRSENWVRGEERFQLVSMLASAHLIAGAVPFHLRFHDRALTMVSVAIVLTNALIGALSRKYTGSLEKCIF